MKKELTIDMLAAVKRPDRYTGGEFGSIVKQDAEVRMALAFPDVYEVGMSYLGFKILYHLVNKMDGIAAERVYAPWVDMEQLMRERGVVLTTLETKMFVIWRKYQTFSPMAQALLDTLRDAFHQ